MMGHRGGSWVIMEWFAHVFALMEGPSMMLLSVPWAWFQRTAFGYRYVFAFGRKIDFALNNSSKNKFNIINLGSCAQCTHP